MPDTIVPFNLRLPDALHKQLSAAAEASGSPSLHSEILNRLIQTLGPDPRLAEVFEALALPRAIRLRASSTMADVNRILAVAGMCGVDRVILGAKAEHLNNAVMVLVMQTGEHTFLVDQTYINLARRPRQSEFRELTRGLDRLGLLKTAQYAPKLLPDTTALPPEEAAAKILNEGKLQDLPRLSAYLKVLAAGARLLFEEKEFLLSKR